MKFAFHFNADHVRLGKCYGRQIDKQVFKILLREHNVNIHSRILCGDLLLQSMTMDIEKIPTGSTHNFNHEKLVSAIQGLVFPQNLTWHSISQSSVQSLQNNPTYVIFFESLNLSDGKYVSNILSKKLPYFLGAIQVNESSRIHRVAYADSLIASYRLNGKNLKVL